VADADGPIAELAYGDTALIRRTNLGRRRRKNPHEHGFWLDLARGNWLTEKAADDLDAEDSDIDDVGKAKLKDKVIPYVEDTRNILLFRVAEAIGEKQAATRTTWTCQCGAPFTRRRSAPSAACCTARPRCAASRARRERLKELLAGLIELKAPPWLSATGNQCQISAMGVRLLVI
jgi:hypothetical protein